MQREKHADLEKLAKALIEHETLTADEIKQALNGSLQKEPVAKKEAQSDVEALLGQGIAHKELEKRGNEAFPK